MSEILDPIDAQRIQQARDEQYLTLFLEAVTAENAVAGWLDHQEAIRLYSLAHNTPDDHPICVEIGSWLGKSTLMLGFALKLKTGAKLYAVDPFDLCNDEPWHIQMLRQQIGDVPYTRKQMFNGHMVSNGLGDIVLLYQGFSQDLYQYFEPNIDLLFIDGDHRYESVLRDFRLWSPLVKPGGVIAFHDYRPPGDIHDGPRLVIDTYVRDDPYWCNHRLVGSIFSASKRA